MGIGQSKSIIPAAFDILRISPKRQTCDIISDISNITTFLGFQKLLISWRNMQF